MTTTNGIKDYGVINKDPLWTEYFLQGEWHKDHGYVKSYNKEGILLCTYYMDNGRKIGTYKTFDNKANLIRETDFNKNK